ncbi:PREDICTED: uncharacterized protein LOC106818652 [Priapulus caudatus]|uniref:Uncharacterized protein LOC106818652 n=1 Tax=Priapulus caudatus TaxID=37621 RepID=A0ABM1F304_PRICU|nr:PREDICTED: uncharacterized protein LOC106818652 [Priapulus caudatus]
MARQVALRRQQQQDVDLGLKVLKGNYSSDEDSLLVCPGMRLGRDRLGSSDSGGSLTVDDARAASEPSPPDRDRAPPLPLVLPQPPSRDAPPPSSVAPPHDDGEPGSPPNSVFYRCFYCSAPHYCTAPQMALPQYATPPFYDASAYMQAGYQRGGFGGQS